MTARRIPTTSSTPTGRPCSQGSILLLISGWDHLGSLRAFTKKASILLTLDLSSHFFLKGQFPKKRGARTDVMSANVVSGFLGIIMAVLEYGSARLSGLN